MNILLMSDLHIEIAGFFSIEEASFDVIVLAGDIHAGDKGVRWAIEEAEIHGKPVIYVAGNHEYYGREYFETLAIMRKKAEEHPLVHFLERDEVVIDGVRFLGATLWTDYMSTGKDDQKYNMIEARLALNDHRLIQFGEQRFKPEHALSLHNETVTWLEQRLDEPFDGDTVVITHHGPSLKCAHPLYGNNTVGSCFISDLDYLVEKADVWCFGHTHSCLDVRVGNCRLVSNQKGYPREPVPGGFRQDWLIDVPGGHDQ